MGVSQKTGETIACWNCGAASTGAHFCAACGRIQPLPADAGYFSMFELPVRLNLDAAALEQKFLQLSWKLHPDNFVRAGEYERELSLERSSQLNDAYRTLQDPVSRVEYLLAREGARKEGAAKQQAPPELLEEVFELNESLDELRSARAEGGDTADLRNRLLAAQKTFQEKLAEVDAEVSRAFTDWDSLAATANGNAADSRSEWMARMNEILNRRSYIRNLVNTVQAELSES